MSVDNVGIGQSSRQNHAVLIRYWHIGWSMDKQDVFVFQTRHVLTEVRLFVAQKVVGHVRRPHELFSPHRVWKKVQSLERRKKKMDFC